MKIVIVGGGTAGWLAGLIISKLQPLHQVTVIESSKIGIIGAGEGSTGLFTTLLSGQMFDLGTSIEEFIIETGASLKYGIMHKNWTPKKDYEYFGPLGGSPTAGNVFDWNFLGQMSKDPNNIHLTSLEGICYQYDLTDYSFKFNDNQFAFHFDAHKVGQYLKKKSTTVKSIDAIVKHVVLDEKGNISKLHLDNDQIIKGDFFIDASGFSRVLMNKLENTWISYSKNLPVNSAMPFLLPSEEKTKPYTTAWAQSAGWMWQIPTLERRGCGYVFCDDYITPDQAQQEIETTLGHAIDPIRVLKFDTGKLDKAWVKNCVAIGLASAFAEPLEATSIHSTCAQLLQLVFNGLQRGAESYIENKGNVDVYNLQTSLMYENYRDFLNIHYMGGRQDTEFWKYMSTDKAKTDQTKAILDICNYRVPNSKDFINLSQSAGYDIWIYVLAGLGLVTQEMCNRELNGFNKNQIYKEVDLYLRSVKNERNNNLKVDNLIRYMKEQYNANTICS